MYKEEREILQRRADGGDEDARDRLQRHFQARKLADKRKWAKHKAELAGGDPEVLAANQERLAKRRQDKHKTKLAVGDRKAKRAKLKSQAIARVSRINYKAEPAEASLPSDDETEGTLFGARSQAEFEGDANQNDQAGSRSASPVSASKTDYRASPTDSIAHDDDDEGVRVKEEEDFRVKEEDEVIFVKEEESNKKPSSDAREEIIKLKLKKVRLQKEEIDLELELKMLRQQDTE